MSTWPELDTTPVPKQLRKKPTGTVRNCDATLRARGVGPLAEISSRIGTS